MFKVFRDQIARQIAPLAGRDEAQIADLLEVPNVNSHGDLALAIPKLKIKGNPVQIAKEWSVKVETNEYITKVSSTAIFMNFRISQTLLRNMVFDRVVAESDRYGTNTSGAGKTAVVEFSSPNIAKEFHAGHLRSTIIGNFVRNVLNANGWKTIAMNYLGDWGKQFGFVAIGYEKYGSETELAERAIKHLYEVYVKINADAREDPTIHDQAREYFKRMEDGDPQALSLWEKFRTMSIEKYKEVYARLNVHFDVYSGESQVNSESINQALTLLEERGLSQESEGAKIVDLSEYGLARALVQKSDGTTLYITRDIGAAIDRMETYQFDKIYYVVASQQDLHLAQLFKILELLGFPWADRFHHINFGMVNGMSTRKGTVVLLEDILENAQEVMHDTMRRSEDKYALIENPEETARLVGNSAIFVQDMAARRNKNYDFNMQRMCSFEGDTGPYLQYAHARLCSIERRSQMEVTRDVDLSLLDSPHARDLIDLIAQYPDVVASCVVSLEPCNIVQYALKLSHSVSLALQSLRVVGEEEAKAKAHLLLFWSARVTLGNALRLIGLVPLERM